jgi:wyosine [tRNA(Phe)-imidazoG37] synthetase (radical SAM superfamily)
MGKDRAKTEKEKRLIYGPVPSRRLGFSLGVDIIPYKVCPYNCIYCQLGKTTNKTLRRKSYVSPAIVIKGIKAAISENKKIDYITFSGSGEPTLNKDLGILIQKTKKITSIQVAVLTNGSLLWRKSVREDLALTDLVVPSLDAVSAAVFKKINSPAKGLNIKKVLDGIKKFAENFKGEIRLEIMLVKGINDSEKEIKKINEFIKDLEINKIELNTVIRPPNDPQAKPLTKEELFRIKKLFHPDLKVKIISDFTKHYEEKIFRRDLEQRIIDLIKRRPCRKEEMAVSLGVHLNELLKYLNLLVQKKKIKKSKKTSQKDFYILNQ